MSLPFPLLAAVADMELVVVLGIARVPHRGLYGDGV